jgi:hypothetical protein
MVRRARPSAEVPPGFILGANIDLSSWHGGELVVDVADNVHCYVGYTSENQPFDLPYYAPCVALRDKGGRASYRFVELRRGMLRKTSFLRDDSHYCLLDDRWLVLPRGAESYFGVIDRKSREEDVERTRQVFGGTRSDIESVATALSKIIGRGYHEMVQLPRVTFSRTRNNSCDISGCLIPKDFPYLAFENSQYDWSHMSLHAFFRLLAFLCPSGRANPVRRALLETGVSEDVLSILLRGAEEYGQPLPYPQHRS